MSHSELLSQVPLFATLASAELERLSSRLKSRRCARDEVIFLRGDEGTDLFIIQKGEVTIRLSSSEGKEVTLALLRKGDSFGELALLDGEPRSTDAVAREETWLLSLRKEDFQPFLEEKPEVVPRLLANLSRMTRRVTQTVHDTNFLDARARLARVLLDLAPEQPDEEKVDIPSRLTQAELANLCGLTRESTNRWLRFYVREGLLSYEGGVITLLDTKHLRLNTD
jgi:CRP-like cAMP-binding protein